MLNSQRQSKKEVINSKNDLKTKQIKFIMKEKKCFHLVLRKQLTSF